MNTVSISNLTTGNQSAIIGGTAAFTTTVRPPPHTEVLDWASRVVTNGGAFPSDKTLNAMSDFYIGLSNNNLLSKMKTVNCFVPDNLIAAITPLITTAGSDPWTNANFAVADLSVNGLTGNGTDKYLNTGMNCSTTFVNPNDTGISIYGYNLPQEHRRQCGAYQENTVASIVQLYNTGAIEQVRAAIANNAGTLLADFPGNGFFVFDRESDSSLLAYFGNSSTSFDAFGWSFDVNPVSSPNANMYVFAYNAEDVAYSFCTSTLSFIAFHTALGGVDAAVFFNLVQTLRMSLGGGYR